MWNYISILLYYVKRTYICQMNHLDMANTGKEDLEKVSNLHFSLKGPA